uniref:hypothetical protein n=1 Tax=Flavobacterium sp. TaxID=239 RepID=UPI00404B71C0
MDNSFGENITLIVGVLYFIFPWMISFKIKYKLAFMFFGITIVLLNLIKDSSIINMLLVILMLIPLVMMRFKFDEMIK